MLGAVHTAPVEAADAEEFLRGRPLDPETIVMVGPGVKRKIFTGDEPMRLLAIGGIPGKPYEAPENPEIRIDTSRISPEEAAELIAERLLGEWAPDL